MGGKRMRCPGNIITCKVKQVLKSKQKFGSPPTLARILYKCEVHSYFIYHVAENVVSRFFSDMPDID
jgi:hypothetical protein